MAWRYNGLRQLTLCSCLQRKPWTELVDRNAFSRPANLTEVHLHAPGSVLYHLQRGKLAYHHRNVANLTSSSVPLECCHNICICEHFCRQHVPSTRCLSGQLLPSAQALSRFKKNSAYFRINYFVFILLTTVVCMVMNPSSLVVLGLLGALWFYLFIVRQAAITIGGRAFRCCIKHVACIKELPAPAPA
jgi:PRA1 family protein